MGNCCVTPSLETEKKKKEKKQNPFLEMVVTSPMYWTTQVDMK
ncbi:hypothetical protein CsSME_00025227 [Camellia sinensis var. sinensis]